MQFDCKFSNYLKMLFEKAIDRLGINTGHGFSLSTLGVHNQIVQVKRLSLQLSSFKNVPFSCSAS